MDPILKEYLQAILEMLPTLTEQDFGTIKLAISLGAAYASTLPADFEPLVSATQRYEAGTLDNAKAFELVLAVERTRLAFNAIKAMLELKPKPQAQGGGQ